MEASNVTSTLFSQLDFRSERQKVITSNIANINTPNYKTKDLVFDQELDKATSKNTPVLQMAKTSSTHFSNVSAVNNIQNPRLIEVQGLEEQNDGNNVSLDTQMGEMSKNKMLFDALQSSIKKDSRLFRSVIESSAKN